MKAFLQWLVVLCLFQIAPFLFWLDETPDDIFKGLLKIGALSTLGALPMLRPSLMTWLYGAAVLIVTFALSAGQLFHLATFGVPINLFSLFAAFSTSSFEAREFATAYVSPIFAVATLSALLLVLWLVVRNRPKRLFEARAFPLALVLVGSSAAGIGWLTSFAYRPQPLNGWTTKLPYSVGRDQRIVYSAFLDLLRQYEAEQARLDGYREKWRAGEIDFEVTTKPLNGVRRLAILILGESVARHHLQLYGYERETTPRLGTRNDLLTFDRVISPHSHTVPSLMKALTLRDSENESNARTAVTLMDLFRAAGYRVHWISNQVAFGEWDTFGNYLSERADTRVFVNTNGKVLDEAVLAPLERRLSEREDDQLVLVHLIGAHMEYCDRFPSNAGYELDAPPSSKLELTTAERATIDCYDAALRYQDTVVSEILELVAAEEAESFVLYLADHGEEVYRFRKLFGHQEVVSSRYMFEIPFVLWTSPSYAASHAEALEQLEAHRSEPYNIEDLAHTLAEMSGFGFPLFDPTRSLASASFTTKESYVRSYRWEDEPTKYRLTSGEEFRFDEKLWLHRVNSVERLDIVEKSFRGFEIDLVYSENEGYFDVRHPPAPSIGLSLEQLMAGLEDPSAHDFWLDVKNLDPTPGPFRRLEDVVEKLGIARRQIIVESGDPQALTRFHDAGYVTSFYLPWVGGKEPSEKFVVARDLSRAATGARFHAISQNAYQLGFMKELFPDDPKLVWYLDAPMDDPASRAVIDDLQTNEKVRVVLGVLETPGYR